MGVATGISAGLGVIGGISSMISGAKEKRDAENALNNYKRQELNNVTNGLQVSTLGSDLQRQEQSRLASGQIQSARESGSRGLIGSLGRIEAGNQRVMQQTGADLDMQQKQIDQMRAEDEARIRSMQENREIGDLSALSSQLQSGKQDMNMGMGNIIQGVGMFGGAMGKQGNPTGGYETSGSAMDMTNPAYQSQKSEQFNTANTYGNFFSRNPYTPPSQNVGYPSWYTGLQNSLSNQKLY